MKTTNLIVAIASGVLLGFGCGHSVKKVDYNAVSNTSEEVAKLRGEMDEARAQHVDVLAAPDFRNAEKYFDQSKDRLADGASQEKILDSLGYAKAYLLRAREVAEERRPRVAGILDARQAALTAGATSFMDHKKTLESLDDDLRSLVDDRRITPSEFSKMQGRYLDLEDAIVQETHLANARTQVKQATSANARSLAPQSLNKAELSLRDAENVITANRRLPEAYMPAVQKANADAAFLTAVMAQVRRPEGAIAESAAIDLVNKDRQLTSMGTQLDATAAEASQKARDLAAAQAVGQEQAAQLDAANSTLSEKDSQLSSAQRRLDLVNALNQARRDFSPREAQVFTQGDKIIIRLTSIGFATGKADVPAKSSALLEKVKNVATQLSAQQVVVEGHTDATGSADVNTVLSQERARSVADFLVNNGLEDGKVTAVGFGNEKPVASNKTKAGRAQNRRVDVTIVPAGAGASETTESF